MNASSAEVQDLLDRLMPFHLRVDRSLSITHVAPLLKRMAPDLGVGTPLFRRFEMQPSLHVTNFDAVQTYLAGRLVILRLDKPFVQLRGGFVPLPGNEELLFAGSLWVTELERLSELGLAASMLPPNDPLIDLLMTHRLMMTAQQSAQRALTSMRESEMQKQLDALNHALRERTAELDKANAALRALPKPGA